MPRIIAPQSSLSSWLVLGAERETGRFFFWTPSAMTSRQSLWISPERKTFQVLSTVAAVPEQERFVDAKVLDAVTEADRRTENMILLLE